MQCILYVCFALLYRVYRNQEPIFMACEVIMKPFHIPKIPATTNKSIRFPNDVIEQVEEAIRGTDCTFSAFVVEATRVALENLKEQQDSQS